MASNSLSYIGLAFRAGKTLAGTAACEKGMKREKVRLLLLQEGLSPGSRQRFIRLADQYHVDVRTMDQAHPFGPAIGRAEIMVLGITDHGFADIIRNIIDGVKGVAEHE